MVTQAAADCELALMSRRIVILPALKEFEEFLGPPLLKDAHEGALDSLHLCAGNLGDLPIPIDKASCNLLELEITGDVGVNKDLGQFSRGDNEFGNEIHGIVTVAPKLLRSYLIRTELAIKLENGEGQ